MYRETGVSHARNTIPPFLSSLLQQFSKLIYMGDAMSDAFTQHDENVRKRCIAKLEFRMREIQFRDTFSKELAQPVKSSA
jgi:hypothetical protein